jgi:DNA repair protein RadD
LRSKQTGTFIDVSGVHRRGGEFIESELQKAADDNEITKAAIQEILALGKDRRSWLAFCCGVAHAEHTAEEMRNAGIEAECIHGEMAHRERDRLVADFKSGKIQAITNANILTTGFDHPPLDLIALLRPTLSTGLYVQMLGRGMRTSPGKENCLILDFARNIERHGPVDRVRPKRDEGGGKMEGEREERKASIWTCPTCREIVSAELWECPDCGYERAKTFLKLDPTASTAAVMSRDEKDIWTKVDDWEFFRHEKYGGGTPSVRVEYRCGLTTIKEWICPEHEGGARRKFVNWWFMHNGRSLQHGERCPEDIYEALSRSSELHPPSEILVKRNGKYFDIVSRRFSKVRELA